jgi:hypothetical protein
VEARLLKHPSASFAAGRVRAERQPRRRRHLSNAGILARSPRASTSDVVHLAELAGEEEVMVRVFHWVCSVLWPVEKTIMEWKREAWKVNEMKKL